MGLDVEILYWNPACQTRDDAHVYEYSGRYMMPINRIVCKSLKTENIPNPLRCKLKRRTLKEIERYLERLIGNGGSGNSFTDEALLTEIKLLIQFIENGWRVEYNGSW